MALPFRRRNPAIVRRRQGLMQNPQKRKIMKTKAYSPSISTKLKAWFSLNPNQVFAREEKIQREMLEQYQHELVQGHIREAHKNFAAESRAMTEAAARKHRQQIRQIEEIVRRELMLKKIPKELRRNRTFMKNYARELSNVLAAYGQMEVALKNPAFVGAITTTLINNVGRMSPSQRIVYLTNKKNFASLIAHTTGTIMEQMQM
ncbi:MAG: hypothetical protein GX950_01985 [Candidatus Diapherotrites archaeon]|jgi:hypothetical protein|uniref:Uncharacterized protein n=1 Tax=Candidatus Iainarchaeum sp. TaxID=3101447 RepID=A0A7K4BZ64_9ARCH|nr:hypothetical protein [Candidatus Diapherotrites archaeon]